MRDHVAEAWRCHGLAASWDEIAARLDGTGVPETQNRMKQRPHTWSGGMLKRASITAAALVPPVLISDEPTSALDADRAPSVLDALRAQGAAVVLISHDMGLVLQNADCVCILHDGRIVETEPPRSLAAGPRHPETARQLGASARH